MLKTGVGVFVSVTQTKDDDPLIGIFELTSPRRFRNLSAIRRFTVVFHEFGSRYIEQLGRQGGSATRRRKASPWRATGARTWTT